MMGSKPKMAGPAASRPTETPPARVGIGDPDDPGSGEAACDGAAFSVGEAREWWVPAVAEYGLRSADDPIAALSGTRLCETEQDLSYTTVDLTGDGQLNLVVTDDCHTAGGGADRWLLFPGIC